MATIRIVEGHRSINRAGDEKVASRCIGHALNRLVKLSELLCHLRLLNVEDSHGSRLKSHTEYVTGRMSGQCKWLIDRACELDVLVEVLDVPQADALVS